MLNHILRGKLDNKEKIMGFGHRVYRFGDPRAKHLREMSRKLTELTGEPELYDMSVRLRALLLVKRNFRQTLISIQRLLYHSLGIDHDLFTPIFAVSRVSGWLAHILEQYENNRLIRPRAEYIGPGMQKYVPIWQRG